MPLDRSIGGFHGLVLVHNLFAFCIEESDWAERSRENRFTYCCFLRKADPRQDPRVWICNADYDIVAGRNQADILAQFSDPFRAYDHAAHFRARALGRQVSRGIDEVCSGCYIFPVDFRTLHPIQEKLLRLADNRNLSYLSLREIGSLVGDRSPQKIKHHLQQLERRGLLRIDRVKGVIEKPKKGWIDGFLRKGRRLLTIPIVGVANCGPANILAEENRIGYLRVSSSLLHRQTTEGLFALRADGFSMNRARINGKSIEDGDYLIIDGNQRSPSEGQVILSIIDGAANVKRFHEDKKNHQIVLLSDSALDFAPIHIHPEDDFFVNGRVIDIVKAPR